MKKIIKDIMNKYNMGKNDKSESFTCLADYTNEDMNNQKKTLPEYTVVLGRNVENNDKYLCKNILEEGNIAFVGKRGVGKSTILKSIVKQVSPLKKINTVTYVKGETDEIEFIDKVYDIYTKNKSIFDKIETINDEQEIQDNLSITLVTIDDYNTFISNLQNKIKGTNEEIDIIDKLNFLFAKSEDLGIMVYIGLYHEDDLLEVINSDIYMRSLLSNFSLYISASTELKFNALGEKYKKLKENIENIDDHFIFYSVNHETFIYGPY